MFKWPLSGIEIDLTNQCNLNCKGCSHFAPLAYNNIMKYDISVFEQDLYELETKFRIREIRLLGGEPFLLDNLIEYVRICHNIFPATHILIVTNGILEDKINYLLQYCKDNDINNIEISVSMYPDHVKYKNKSIHSRNVVLFRKLNLTTEPINNMIKEVKRNCLSSHCISLFHGRLYLCPIMKNLSTLEKSFNLNFNIGEDDMSIDIYKHTASEIIWFLTSSTTWSNCCSHCANVSTNFKWELSNRNKDEWLLTEGD